MIPIKALLFTKQKFTKLINKLKIINLSIIMTRPISKQEIMNYNNGLICLDLINIFDMLITKNIIIGIFYANIIIYT